MALDGARSEEGCGENLLILSICYKFFLNGSIDYTRHQASEQTKSRDAISVEFVTTLNCEEELQCAGCSLVFNSSFTMVTSSSGLTGFSR